MEGSEYKRDGDKHLQTLIHGLLRSNRPPLGYRQFCTKNYKLPANAQKQTNQIKHDRIFVKLVSICKHFQGFVFLQNFVNIYEA
jgi:hypothetical protein